MLKQLLDKEIIQRPVFSLMLINDHEGILSIGGTAAGAVRMVAAQTTAQLDRLGAVEHEEDSTLARRALVKRGRTTKKVAARQTDWEAEWVWSEVRGTDGWWQILMQSMLVDDSRVLQNQAMVIDVSFCRFYSKLNSS